MAQSKGKQVQLDVTAFDMALSSADNTVQKALETLDEAGLIVRKASTTDATPTTVFTYAIPADTAVGIAVDVVAKRTNGTGRLYFQRTHLAYREGAAAAAFEGAEQTPLSKDGPGNPAYDVEIQLSTNNLILVVTGIAAHNMEWTAKIKLTVAA